MTHAPDTAHPDQGTPAKSRGSPQPGAPPTAGDAPRPEVTDDVVDAIAAEVYADRRTVVRRLAGLPVRGRVQERIDRAIANLRTGASK